MDKVKVTRYRCSICKCDYRTEAEAVMCEAVPVTGDTGVLVGDEIYTLEPYGIDDDSKAKVARIGICGIGNNPKEHSNHHKVVLYIRDSLNYTHEILPDQYEIKEDKSSK